MIARLPNTNGRLDRRLSVAPMMECTDRHDRFFLRLISRHTLLYTEMVAANTLVHADPTRFLRFNDAEHPVALQLGGSDPDALAVGCRLAEEFGYDEVNLNVGCPSDRVQSGRFGACLMAEPELVADCVAAMKQACGLPVTVKTRIGIDDRDSYEELGGFVAAVAAAGAETLIVHARKAWLNGLSPKENRTVPPLRYDRVHALKRDFPALEIVINGGIRSVGEAVAQLAFVDGVMIGREAYGNPYMLAEADRLIFGDAAPVRSRAQVLEEMLVYIERELAEGASLKWIVRHLFGLFQGQPGARAWRRYLTENAGRPNAGAEVVREAADLIQPATPRLAG